MSSTSLRLQNGTDKRLEKSAIPVPVKSKIIPSTCTGLLECASLQNGTACANLTDHQNELDLCSVNSFGVADHKDKEGRGATRSSNSDKPISSCRTKCDNILIENGLHVSSERENCSSVVASDSLSVETEAIAHIVKLSSPSGISIESSSCCVKAENGILTNGDLDNLSDTNVHKHSSVFRSKLDSKHCVYNDQSSGSDLSKLRDSFKSSLKQHSNESFKHRKSVTIEEGLQVFGPNPFAVADTCDTVVANDQSDCATALADDRVEVVSGDSPRRNRTRSEGDDSCRLIEIPIVRCRSYELKQIDHSCFENSDDDDSCEETSSIESTATNDEDDEDEEDDKETHKKWALEAESEKEVCSSPDGRFLKFDKEIGCGSFKTVYKGLDTKSDPSVHVAWCELQERTWNKSERERFQEEAEMLKTLQHPNIVRFYDFFEMAPTKCKGLVVLVTELMTSGTLKTYIRRFQRVNTKVLKNWCRQILKGLLFLHSRSPPVIHRDLKCDNIFIAGPTGAVKIGDLGLATLKKQSFAKSVIGTPEFMAPEMYDERYNESVDIYAFGMCMMEMSTGQYPYTECHSTAQIFKRVISGIRPEAFDKISDPEVKHVIGECLHRNPGDRYTVKELLQLEFFAEDTGIRVDLVRPAVDTLGDVIQLQLHVTHARRRGLQQRENEAVRFSYNIVTDHPEAVAHEMVKSGYAHEEDASTVSRQIKNRVLQLKQAREAQLQADASRLLRVPSVALQNTESSVQTDAHADHVNGASETAAAGNHRPQLSSTDNSMQHSSGYGTLDGTQPRSVVCVTMKGAANGVAGDSMATSNRDAEIAAVSVAIPKASRRSREHRNPSGSGGSGTKLKRRIGAARTSAVGVAPADPSSPKLKFVNVEFENEIELIECQLETDRHQSVSFKFSRFTDRPDDIAANMVIALRAVCQIASCVGICEQVEKQFLTRDQVETFVKEIVDIIDLCRDHPRQALAVATQGLSVLGSVHPATSVPDETDGVLVLGDGMDGQPQHGSVQPQKFERDSSVDDSTNLNETAPEVIDSIEVSDDSLTKHRLALASSCSIDAVTQTDNRHQETSELASLVEDQLAVSLSSSSGARFRRTSLEPSSCSAGDLSVHTCTSSSNENSVVKAKVCGAGNLDFEHLKMELDKLTGQCKVVGRQSEQSESGTTMSPTPSTLLLHSHSSVCVSGSTSSHGHQNMLKHTNVVVRDDSNESDGQINTLVRQQAVSQHTSSVTGQLCGLSKQLQPHHAGPAGNTGLHEPNVIHLQHTSSQLQTSQIESHQLSSLAPVPAAQQQVQASVIPVQQHSLPVYQHQASLMQQELDQSDSQHLAVNQQQQTAVAQHLQSLQSVPPQAVFSQLKQNELQSIVVQQLKQQSTMPNQPVVSHQHQFVQQSVSLTQLDGQLYSDQQLFVTQPAQNQCSASEQSVVQQFVQQTVTVEHSQSQQHVDQRSLMGQQQLMQQQPVSIQQQMSAVKQQLQQQTPAVQQLLEDQQYAQQNQSVVSQQHQFAQQSVSSVQHLQPMTSNQPYGLQYSDQPLYVPQMAQNQFPVSEASVQQFVHQQTVTVEHSQSQQYVEQRSLMGQQQQQLSAVTQQLTTQHQSVAVQQLLDQQNAQQNQSVCQQQQFAQQSVSSTQQLQPASTQQYVLQYSDQQVLVAQPLQNQFNASEQPVQQYGNQQTVTIEKSQHLDQRSLMGQQQMMQQQLSAVTQQLQQQQQLAQQQSVAVQQLLEQQNAQHQSSVMQQLLQNVQQASIIASSQSPQSDIVKQQQFSLQQQLSASQQQSVLQQLQLLHQQMIQQLQPASSQQHPFMAQQQYVHQEAVVTQQQLINQQSYAVHQASAASQHHSILGQLPPVEMQQPAVSSHYPLVPHSQQPLNQQPFIMSSLPIIGQPHHQVQQTLLQQLQQCVYPQHHPLLLMQQMQPGALPQTLWQPAVQSMPNMAYAAHPQPFGASLLGCAQLQMLQSLLEGGVSLPLAQDLVIRQMTNPLAGVYPSGFPNAAVQIPVAPVLGYMSSSDLASQSTIPSPTAQVSTLLPGSGALQCTMASMPSNVQLAYFQMMQLLSQPNPLITPQILQTMFNQAMLPVNNTPSVGCGFPQPDAPSELGIGYPPQDVLNANQFIPNLALQNVDSLEPHLPQPLNAHVSCEQVTANTATACDSIRPANCLSELPVTASKSVEIPSLSSKKKLTCPVDLASLEIALRERLGHGPKPGFVQNIPAATSLQLSNKSQETKQSNPVLPKVGGDNMLDCAASGNVLSASMPEMIAKDLLDAAVSCAETSTSDASTVARIDRTSLTKRRFSVVPVKATDECSIPSNLAASEKEQASVPCGIVVDVDPLHSNGLSTGSNSSAEFVVSVSTKAAQPGALSSCHSAINSSIPASHAHNLEAQVSISKQHVTDAAIAATATQLAHRHIAPSMAMLPCYQQPVPSVAPLASHRPSTLDRAKTQAYSEDIARLSGYFDQSATVAASDVIQNGLPTPPYNTEQLLGFFRQLQLPLLAGNPVTDQSQLEMNTSLFSSTAFSPLPPAPLPVVASVLHHDADFPSTSDRITNCNSVLPPMAQANIIEEAQILAYVRQQERQEIDSIVAALNNLRALHSHQQGTPVGEVQMCGTGTVPHQLEHNPTADAAPTLTTDNVKLSQGLLRK